MPLRVNKPFLLIATAIALLLLLIVVIPKLKSLSVFDTSFSVKTPQKLMYIMEEEPQPACVMYTTFNAYSIKEVNSSGDVITDKSYGFGEDIDTVWGKLVSLRSDSDKVYVIADETQSICMDWVVFISYSVWSKLGDKKVERMAMFNDASEAFAVSLALSNDTIKPVIKKQAPVKGKIDTSSDSRKSQALKEKHSSGG